jgi:hypothetical protein
MGNLDAPSWYTTNDASGRAPVPEEVRKRHEASGRATRWINVTPDRSWGWFDDRLHARPLVAPRAVVDAGVPADLGTWAVPVRYLGKMLKLAGRIVYQPVHGTFEYSIHSGHVTSTALTLTLRSGGPGDVPLLTLKSAVPEPDAVLVYGVVDEEFLEFTAKQGVAVNKLSPTWLQIQRARGQAPPDFKVDPEAPFDPLGVADRPEFQWPEFRALYGQQEPPENVIRLGRPVDVLQWWVRMSVFDDKGEKEVVAFQGLTRWVPIKSPEAHTGGLMVAFVVGGVCLLALICLTLLWVRRRRKQQGRSTGDKEGTWGRRVWGIGHQRGPGS